MNVIYSTMVLTVWFMSTFFVVTVLLIILEKRRQLFAKVGCQEAKPKVSIILPAYNEEEGILPALISLSNITYPKDLYEVIVVNDGSSDNTSALVKEFISQNRFLNIVFIDRVENQGKSYSLNEAIRRASGELIACMDGDSLVKPDILSQTVGYFSDPKMGSVSVRVNVREPKNFLEKVIDVEYVVGLSISLKILSFLNIMHVTPGPFSIYRKSVLTELGGFDETNITEDLEIAFRIQKAGYKLSFCLSTSVSTIVPSSIKSLFKQRKRWYSGSLLTVWQHKDMMFNRKMGLFGIYVPFNYSLITMGMMLFIYSIYLFSSKILKNINYLSLVNFDLSHFNFVLELDPLSIDIFTTMAFTMICITVILTKLSFNTLGRRIRENVLGFIGFVFFFVFYQMFWLNSFYSVLTRKEVKWR
ncbi:MAG: glycosyltransferase [Candidatus Altiarchaeota archaeon]